jgi:hypothetical protein
MRRKGCNDMNASSYEARAFDKTVIPRCARDDGISVASTIRNVRELKQLFRAEP